MRRTSGWLVVLAACGGAGDAPDARVSIDGPPPIDSGPPGPLAVSARTRCCTDFDAPVAGVSIVVGGVEVAVTDGDGAATVEVEPGATLTAVYPDGALVTWMGVEPGDTLVLGEYFVDLATVTATETVTWGPQTGFNTWRIFDGCAATAHSAGVSSTPIRAYADGCGTPTTDVLVVACDDWTPVHWAMLRDHAIVDAASTPMPDFVDATPMEVGMTGLDAAVTDTYVRAIPMIGGLEGIPLATSGVPTGGAIRATGPWAAASSIRLIAELYAGGAPPKVQVVTQTLAGDATSAVLASPPLLPWIENVYGDSAGRRASWDESGGGDYTAVVVDLTWGQSLEHHWRVIAPRGAESAVRWPGLPAAFDDLEPTGADAVFPAVTLLELDGMSYDAIRTLPEYRIVSGPGAATPRVETKTF